MLVLTRMSNQSFMIGDDVEVVVIAVVGQKAVLGVRAPRDVQIVRSEIFQPEATGSPPAPSGRAAVSPAASPASPPG